ncbi:MAG: hypothetical protein GPOALKHO_000727 [Sodalis sp.]|nr:MAG: hypothetical protein GPOALKHO_000727 [Sodalis sp.]
MPRFPDFIYYHDAAAKTRNHYIAGLFPLFHTFSLLANYIVGSERGSEALRTMVLFDIHSLI